jgi:exopolysaccharide production protein ExoQ
LRHSLSAILLFSWFAVRQIVFERRDDPASLLEEGLTLQNKIQVIVTGLGILVAFLVLFRKKVQFDRLFHGPNRMLFIIFFLNLSSCFWSIRPDYTIYRSLELFAFWILAVWFCSRHSLIESLKTFLLIGIVIGWIAGFVTPGGNSFTQGTILGAIKSNVESLMAGGYLLLCLHRKVDKLGRVGAWEWILGSVSLLVFGSIATMGALVIAGVIFFVMKQTSTSRVAWTAVLLSLTIISTLLITQEQLADATASLFLRNPTDVETLSGRTLIWTPFLEALHEHPFGLGFAAGSRFFGVLLYTQSEIGWSPGNLHNGYLAAMIGLGWVGGFLIVVLFLQMIFKAARSKNEGRAFLVAMLLLIAINNLSIEGVGGGFNYAWLILMSIACSLSEVKKLRDREKNIPLTALYAQRTI